MDILLNPEEQEIRDAAREFLAAESSPALARAMEVDSIGYSPELWSKMVELGWLGLSLPSEHGGQDAPLSYSGLLLEEIGRHIAPVPFHNTLVFTLMIAKYGSAAQKERYLSEIIGGKATATFAYQEPSGGIADEEIQLVATKDGEDYVLQGTKSYVDNFAVSDFCIVVCRAARNGDNGDGLFALIVDSASPGVSEIPLITTAKDKQSKVRFDDVRVPGANLLGERGEGQVVVADLLDHAVALLNAQMVGATRRDMEFAVEYSKHRRAFGRPIGAFQSIQHLSADMLIWTDGAELLTREAIWLLGVGLNGSIEVSQAKSFANEKCLAVCRSSQQIHGGIGFIAEFDLNLWYRRVASWSLRLGSSLEHRARIARALLDDDAPVRLGIPLKLPS